MPTGYTINAYSPSLNQTQRQLNLHDLRPITDRRLAEQTAKAFAETLNQQRKLQRTDWQPQIKLEKLGR